MNTSQLGQGGLSGIIVLATIMPASTQPLLTEAQNFKQTLLGPLQIPGAIILNLAPNGYSTLDELLYFGHKDFEDFFSAKIRQALNHDGANYRNMFIKCLQELVWRS